MSLPVKIYRPNPELPLPFSKDPLGNAGWDLYSLDDHEIDPGQILKIPLNIAVEIHQGYWGRVTPRSGLSSEGINVIPGTIDSNYRGIISAITQNFSDSTVFLEKGTRIAQIIIQKHEFVEWVEVASIEDLEASSRGDQGFNSSGLK